MLLHLSREMTGVGQIDLENTPGWRLLAIGAICYGWVDDPRQAISGSALAATLHVLRKAGFRAVTVTLTVQCSEEARLRGPGLRPAELPADELVAEQDGAVTEVAAGNLPVLLVRPASWAGAGTPGRPLGRAGTDVGPSPGPGR